MSEPADSRPATPDEGTDRREFLSASSVAMAAGLAAGYGTFVVMAGRDPYLYPSGAKTKAWQYVAELSGFRLGASIQYEAPTGAKILVARHAANGDADDFVALSSTCPHLGCQVHWEPQNNRFFCPCHNGVFDPEGKAIEGPPAAAGQSLSGYPLRVQDGLLLIEVPVVGLGSPEEV